MSRNYHSPIFESCKPIIKDCVDSWKEEKKTFTNLTELVRKLLPSLNQYTASESTVRRYLKKMDFVFHSSSHYDFEPNTRHFNELVSYLGCIKHFCFLLKKPELGTFFAEKINKYYSSSDVELGNYVHCVAIQDLLICFYKENTQKNVKRNILKEEILELLNEYYFSKI